MSVDARPVEPTAAEATPAHAATPIFAALQAELDLDLTLDLADPAEDETAPDDRS